MEAQVGMATDYIGSAHSVQVNTSACTMENSDVFVWGSNSSHHLAEGSQEKIIVPVKLKSFSQVQQYQRKNKMQGRSGRGPDRERPSLLCARSGTCMEVGSPRPSGCRRAGG